MVEFAGEWSRELCGGTHLRRTSQIGLLNLLAESSIGSGVRRVEALVSTDAFEHFAAERALVSQLTDTLRVPADQLPGRVEKLLSSLKEAEKQIAELKAAQLRAGLDALVASARDIDGVRLLASRVPGVSGNELRTLATDARARFGSEAAVIALVGGGTDKAAAIVATNEAARDQGLKAGVLIGLACAELGGRGGGKDDLAQGGGTNAAAADQALARIEEAIRARG